MDVVELRASSRAPDDDGVSRLVLTRALHARARPDNLVSAVLRVRAASADSGGNEGTVALHLNHWRADQATVPDVRSAGRGTLRGLTETPGCGLVMDVTAQCRQVLATGAPVTLTVVPSTSDRLLEVGAVLSLFMERVVNDVS